jgi:hypothetical protein
LRLLGLGGYGAAHLRAKIIFVDLPIQVCLRGLLLRRGAGKRAIQQGAHLSRLCLQVSNFSNRLRAAVSLCLRGLGGLPLFRGIPERIQRLSVKPSVLRECVIL